MRAPFLGALPPDPLSSLRSIEPALRHPSRVTSSRGRQTQLRARKLQPGRRSYSTANDVDKARAYCLSQLRTGDRDSYLIHTLLPPRARDVHIAARALNLELSRLPETVSSATIGQLRLQFWRDGIRSTLGSSNNPPREPICLLLHAAAAHLGGGRGTLAFWLQRLVSARSETLFDAAPVATLAALEEQAEKTYSSLLYATLAALEVKSVGADHVASHVGKAVGIVATLRGTPVLAAPRGRQEIRTPHGTVDAAAPGAQVLNLPLDVLARHGVREEDVFRRGPEADGIRDAVFETATRAHDHLVTARELLGAARRGEEGGHGFEHEGEEGFVYDGGKEGDGGRDVARAFGVFLDAVPALEYLKGLERRNFDVWQRGRHNWLLPWRLWRAASRQEI